MMLFHAVQLATDLYLEKAYPSGPPPEIADLVEALHQIDSNQSLLAWDGFEQEKDRYALRLGNETYPHMKLVFMANGDCNLFYVDAHDSHFALDSNIPGQEKLSALRKCNCELKKTIEKAWLGQDLPVFGALITEQPKPSAPKTLDVLAIDDEPQILDMLCMCGAGIGLKLECATTVRQAIQAVETKPPDVVLCDIMMPDESGYVFVSWMQEHHPHIPVIYITGLNKDKVEMKGVEAVLQKPFTIRDLSAALEELPLPIQASQLRS